MGCCCVSSAACWPCWAVQPQVRQGALSWLGGQRVIASLNACACKSHGSTACRAPPCFAMHRPLHAETSAPQLLDAPTFLFAHIGWVAAVGGGISGIGVLVTLTLTILDCACCSSRTAKAADAEQGRRHSARGVQAQVRTMLLAAVSACYRSITAHSSTNGSGRGNADHGGLGLGVRHGCGGMPTAAACLAPCSHCLCHAPPPAVQHEGRIHVTS